MPYLGNMTALLKNWVSNNLFYSLTDVTIGVELCIRKRFTIAEINAGATLLAAPGVGFAYRMIDAAMIAVGGAVGATTTVDILATLTSSRKLLAAAQANLTQSAMLRAGGTGGTLLADGASFTRNDSNTAITVGKTGATATTATHVDVIFCYVIEKV